MTAKFFIFFIIIENFDKVCNSTKCIEFYGGKKKNELDHLTIYAKYIFTYMFQQLFISSRVIRYKDTLTLFDIFLNAINSSSLLHHVCETAETNKPWV